MNTPQNGTIWIDGTLADWNAAKIPLMSDALLRSLCAFDGLIAKRQPDGSLALVAPDRHYERLTRTCRVLGLPIELSRSMAIIKQNQQFALPLPPDRKVLEIVIELTTGDVRHKR